MLTYDSISPIQGEIISERSATKGWRGRDQDGCIGGVVDRGRIVAVGSVPVLRIGLHEDDVVGRCRCRRYRGDGLEPIQYELRMRGILCGIPVPHADIRNDEDPLEQSECLEEGRRGTLVRRALAISLW